MKKVERIIIFCNEIWAWYAIHKRVLPWRDLTEKDDDHRAYLVLVSEVMLQQTQVSRVIVLYKNFIQMFPRIEALAKANNAEVLIAWRGLGYNNRAIRLRDTAREIVKIGGTFPCSMEALQKLPGVGHYTAAAIRNFAFQIPTPCIDINIRRILHRFFEGIENQDGTWKKNDAFLLELAEEVLAVACPEPSDTADWHAALMDFGSRVCTKYTPQWHLLSPDLQSVCRAYGKQINRNPVSDSSKGSIRGAAKKEPGRIMAGRFIPNRIFRGRIIEELRDVQRGLSAEDIGSRIAADWSFDDHRMWLSTLMENLMNDGLIECVKGGWRLKE